MHRHGYKGRKFGRERDQRNALMRGLAISLIEHGAIVTTLPKAKDLRPIVEKMVTKARKGGLSNRRALIADHQLHATVVIYASSSWVNTVLAIMPSWLVSNLWTRSRRLLSQLRLMLRRQLKRLITPRSQLTSKRRINNG